MNDLEKSYTSINKWLSRNNKESISLDNLFSKLLDEVKTIWPIMGYPPLVTPYSQYVKNVAIVNVLNTIKGKERWSLIDDNTWDMLLGKSGRLPGDLGDEIIKLSKELKKEFYSGDPQDLVDDSLDLNKKEMKLKGWDFGIDDEELLEYSLHKTQYLDYKSGAAKRNLQKDIISKKDTINTSKESVENIKNEVIQVGSEKYEIKYSIEESVENQEDDLSGEKMLSPIEGRIFFTKNKDEKPIKVNDTVKKGDILCYIESMKVINAIKSEYSGKIKKICFNDGDDIFDDDVLFYISS